MGPLPRRTEKHVCLGGLGQSGAREGKGIAGLSGHGQMEKEVKSVTCGRLPGKIFARRSGGLWMGARQTPGQRPPVLSLP